MREKSYQIPLFTQRIILKESLDSAYFEKSKRLTTGLFLFLRHLNCGKHSLLISIPFFVRYFFGLFIVTDVISYTRRNKVYVDCNKVKAWIAKVEYSIRYLVLYVDKSVIPRVI
ncbi:hypothetical protein VIN7_6950 [Saccharomyces cerevisiae x Saccharomyces kudriavzevii VIN7]|uniref:Uncharacterized protein n=1 Tax=Saccharomyces cerevisiae x Saccharomyces kudriavzevii (strain VIN7) TaxID=1095631 RepID=H0GUG1_SACCK|nr:hypothetical protein VIN7_6950 [Saccharomyces cerevisiae x Saccharomyces kudriavzevii VIN7]